MKLRNLIATLCLLLPLAAFADEPTPSQLQAAKELFQIMNSGASLDQGIATRPTLLPGIQFYSELQVFLCVA